MKAIERANVGRLVVLSAIALFSWPCASLGQGFGWVKPMYVATSESVTDEFGVNLEGNALDPTGDRVEILQVLPGASISPPNPDGSPGEGTEIIAQGVSRIGNLVAEGAQDVGMFAVVFMTNHPPPSSRLFVRAFNADTTSDASFYGDSAIFTVLPNENIYLVEIGSTDEPLDDGDDDGDGLINSYEKSYGSDRYRVDTDGDGMGDMEEHMAGTDLLDYDRLLKIENEYPVSATDVAISFQSVSGRCYQVEYAEDHLADDSVFLPVGDPVAAVADSTTVLDLNGLQPRPRFYRVWVMDESISCE